MRKMIGIVIMVLLVFQGYESIVNPLPVSASATVSETTNRSGSSSQSVTLYMPSFQSLNDISVNTGRVTDYTISGDYVTVYLSGGGYVDRDYDSQKYSKYVSGKTSRHYSSGGYSGSLSRYLAGGSYTPSDSFTAYGSRSCDSRSYCPQSMYWSEEGYSGTLYPYSGVKSFEGYDEDGNWYYKGTNYMKGTVTKPASDTRYYRYKGTVYKGGYENYKYQYTVTVDYEDNQPPEMNVDLTGLEDKRFSDESGHNRIFVSGDVKDNEGDSSTVRYKIGDKVGVIQSNVSDGDSFDGYAVIDSNVSEGDQTLEIWADDGKDGGESSKSTVTIIIDKSAPDISYSLDPSGWTSGDVEIKLQGYDGAGGVRLTPSSRVVSDNGTYAFDTEDGLGNKDVYYVHVSKIDKESPDIGYGMNGNNTYKKSHETKVNVSDTKNGLDKGSGVVDRQYVWSESKEEPKIGYKAFTEGEQIKTPEGVNGNWYLHVKAEDKVGHVSKRVSNVFKLDNEAPDGGKAELSLDGEGKLKVTPSGADDRLDELDNKAFSYRLDNGSFTDWVTSEYVFSGLMGNKIYELDIKVRDRAGNVRNLENVDQLRTMSYKVDGVDVVGIQSDSMRMDILEGYNQSGTSYKVYAKGEDGKEVDSEGYDSKVNGRLIEGLEANRDYEIWVSVRNSDGVLTGDQKVIDQIYSGTEVPKLVLEEATETDMRLRIDKRSNSSETEYMVTRSTSSFFNENIVHVKGWSTDIESVHVGLTPGERYHFKVHARNGDGIVTEVYFPVSYMTLPPQSDLIEAKILSVVDESYSRHLVRWTHESQGTDTYNLYKDGKLVHEVSSEPKDILSIVDREDRFNHEVSYKVSAVNEQGEGKKSNEKSLYSLAKSPEGVDIVDVTGSSISVDVRHSGLNTLKPESQIEVREIGKDKVVSTSQYNRSDEGRKLEGLTLGKAYELWVRVRNEDGVENVTKKYIDEFYMNRPPEINVGLEKDKYSGVEGYNKIKLDTKVKDLDVTPVGDPLKVYYTIKNDKGNVMKGYDRVKLSDMVANGDWQEVTEDILVTDTLIEGYYELELVVEDDQEEMDVGKVEFLIDRTVPKGLLNLEDTRKMTSDWTITGVDGSIAGLHSNAYRLFKKEVEGETEKVSDWVSVSNFTDNGKPNTKYRYESETRDVVGNVRKNSVEMVTSPELVEKQNDYDEGNHSTIVLELRHALTLRDEVAIEVRRSGSIVGKLESGSTFEDKNLDYERDYTYELTPVSKDQQGNRLEGESIVKTVTTGSPDIQLELDTVYDGEKYIWRNTVFSDQINVEGNVFFYSGGEVSLLFSDEDEKRDMMVSPYVKNRFNFLKTYEEGERFSLKAEVAREGYESEVEVESVVKKEDVKVKQVSEEDYERMMNSK